MVFLAWLTKTTGPLREWLKDAMDWLVKRVQKDGDKTLKALTLLAEVVDVARRWADRCDRSRIPCVSAWTSTQAQAINTTS